MAPTARQRPTYAEAARALLRDTLLDAAGDLMRERGWSETTMAGVAAAAGVSRQTLYHEFGSRNDFAQAYVLREAGRFVAAVESALSSRAADPRAALVAAFEVFLGAAAGHPLIRAIVSGDGNDGLLALVTTQGGPVLGLATERLAALLAASWPQLDAARARLVADCLVRLAISHAALPGGTAEATAAAVGEVLGPYLERVVGMAI
ncbi:MAG TPA: TetR family transcriptional regulator [Candidatus Dormibacteraeota bacterium]|nr:TetR family transcriptional regulator [Candidatus Dormibacteraeota bacterium]